MTVTIIGIVSIFLGFCCVMASFYFFRTRADRTLSYVFGALAFVLLTLIPVTSAVFWAATAGGSAG